MRKLSDKNEPSPPRFSIATLIQRGADISIAARMDKPELIACSLNWALVDEIDHLIKPSSEADADWKLAQEKRVAQTKQLEEFCAHCRKFRNRVMAQLRFFAADNTALPPLPICKKTVARVELVQDLFNLYLYCKNNASHLTPIFPDDTTMVTAYDNSNKLSELMADTVLRREALEEFQIVRNERCNRLYYLIKEVTAVARLAFKKDDPRLKKYAYNHLY